MVKQAQLYPESLCTDQLQKKAGSALNDDSNPPIETLNQTLNNSCNSI